MSHQAKISSILSYLDDVEEDTDGNSCHDKKGGRDTLGTHHNEHQRSYTENEPSKSSRKFIWDEWDDAADANNHMASIYEVNETVGDATPSSAMSPMSTISPEPSHRKHSGHSFISPIDSGAYAQSNQRSYNNQRNGDDNMTHHSSSSSVVSVMANAFREVQAKIKAMQTELDERTEEVAVKEREMQNIRLATETSISALEATWKAKNEDQHYTAQAALERQKEFQRRLANDVDKLKSKQEEVSEQISRIQRRREGEIAGARRQAVNNLRAEREHWVSIERSKLAKLAESKESSLKAAAVEELEPMLTELIRKQRLELQDIEIKLKDQFAISVRKHRIKLQRDKDEVSSEIEVRYNKAVGKQREQWSLEFKESMRKCEDDAVRLRHEHDQALSQDREAHDHMWRQLMANKDAQVEDIRSEAATKAAKLASDHSRVTAERSEQLALALQRSRQVGLQLEGKMHTKVISQVIEDRSKLNDFALSQLKLKTSKELEMVESRLNKQFKDEMEGLEHELTEKRVKLAAELDARLEKMNFASFDSNDNSTNNGYGSVAHKEEEVDDVFVKLEKLKRRLENDNEEINKLEDEISEIRDQKNDEQIKLDKLNEEMNGFISKVIHRCEDIEKKSSAEALAVVRKRDKLADQHKQQMTAQQNELSLLKEDLSVELSSVRSRVDAVLSRKENKAAELADALTHLTKVNDERAALLNKLRLGRFQ